MVWKHRAEAAWAADNQEKVLEAEGTGQEFDSVIEDMEDLLPDNVAIDEVMEEVRIRDDRNVILTPNNPCSPRSPRSPPQSPDYRSHSEPFRGNRQESGDRLEEREFQQKNPPEEEEEEEEEGGS